MSWFSVRTTERSARPCLALATLLTWLTCCRVNLFIIRFTLDTVPFPFSIQKWLMGGGGLGFPSTNTEQCVQCCHVNALFTSGGMSVRTISAKLQGGYHLNFSLPRLSGNYFKGNSHIPFGFCHWCSAVIIIGVFKSGLIINSRRHFPLQRYVASGRSPVWKLWQDLFLSPLQGQCSSSNYRTCPLR